jgi:signal transduction histidine kinase
VQVYTNIVINALDAMPLGGRLTVSQTRRNGSVRFSFTDNGVGIEPKTMQSIFEPFKTTRGDAGGAGLGLSIVRWIVQRHNGSVVVESAGLGKGATMLIDFPVISEGAF